MALISGIGRGISLKLAECGAKVVAVCRTKADLDSLKEEVQQIFYPYRELTHFILETPKRVIGKQLRPRTDAAEYSVCSGSPLYANVSDFFSRNI